MIFFDTAAVIWSVQGKAGTGQEAMIPRAKAYLQHLRDQGELVVISAPVLTEYLAAFDFAGQNAQVVELSRAGFWFPPFDQRCASIAAALWRVYRAGKPGPMPAQKVKVDLQVLAIAISNKATALVSSDDYVAKVAEAARSSDTSDVDGLKAIRGLQVIGIPELPPPPPPAPRTMAMFKELSDEEAGVPSSRDLGDDD